MPWFNASFKLSSLCLPPSNLHVSLSLIYLSPFLSVSELVVWVPCLFKLALLPMSADYLNMYFLPSSCNKLSVTLIHLKSRLPSAWGITTCSSEDDEFEIDLNEYEGVLMENVLQPAVGRSVDVLEQLVQKGKQKLYSITRLNEVLDDTRGQN